MKLRIGFTALIAGTSLATFACMENAYAQHHGGDVFVEVFEGAILTSLIDESTIFHDTRVYSSELGEIFPNFTDEPGFDSEAGTFPPGSEVGFDIMDGLRAWDGFDFDTLADSTMTIGFGPLEVETGNGVVLGFSIPVSSNGEWHKHLEFTLNAPADDGIYLLALQLWSTDSSIERSETFYIVFNQELDEVAHDEAVEFVEEALVSGMTFENPVLVTGGRNTWTVHGATPGERVYFGYSLKSGSSAPPGCPGIRLSIRNGKLLGAARADVGGMASYSQNVPGKAAGLTVHFQAAELSTCTLSNWVSHTYQ